MKTWGNLSLRPLMSRDGNLLGYAAITTANLGQTASTVAAQDSYVWQNGALLAQWLISSRTCCCIVSRVWNI